MMNKHNIGYLIIAVLFLLSGEIVFAKSSSNEGMTSDNLIFGDKSIFNSDLSIVDSSTIFDNSQLNIVSAEDEKQIINYANEQSIINPDNAVVSIDFDGIGAYANPYQNAVVSPIYSAMQSPIREYKIDPYINGYGKYLEIVTSIDPKAKDSFVSYFADWARNNEGKDFFSYTEERARAELAIENCYIAALEKFGVGTAVIAVPFVLSYLVPGGSIFSTSLIVIAKTSSRVALLGSASGATLAATFSFLRNDDIEDVVYKTISGAADGFLVGAITGSVSGAWSSIKNFSNAIAFDNKIVNLKSKLVYDNKGELLGKAIRIEGVSNVDDFYYIKKGSTSVFNKDNIKVADVAKYDNGNGVNYVLYNEKGRILGYLDNQNNLVAYGDPSSAALIKNQSRIQPSANTKLQVQENARLMGQYNSGSGRYIDALTGEDIIGTPEMGHIYGNEYTNELQRAYMNGMSESAFKNAMQDPSIYQLQSVSSNRSHNFEAPRITIDDFPGVDTNIGEELWKRLLMQ